MIVQRCLDFTRLLHKLSAVEDNIPPVLTLARGDETFIPANLQEKKPVSRENVQGDIFYKGRNLR
jgi:error-prone DNA polymerase